MKYLTIALICVYITNVSCSCNRTAITEIEHELEGIVSDANFNTSANDYVTLLRNKIEYIKFECIFEHSPLENIDQQCWNTTYRCSGEGYVPGCPCWTYEIDYPNVTATRLNFNKFHPNGPQVTSHEGHRASEEDLLRKCDDVIPPWNWYYLYNGYGGLKEFGHCLEGEDIDCFCSSIRGGAHSSLTEEYDPDDDLTYQYRLSSCYDDDIKLRCHEHNDNFCPCWLYNIIYEGSDANVTSGTSAAQNTADSSVTLKVDAVLCDKPHLNCADERVAPGCQCWEFDLTYSDDPNIINFDLVPKYRFERNVSEYEAFYKKNCRHDDLASSLSPLVTTYFSHCQNGGHLSCFCSGGGIAPLFRTPDCPAGEVKVLARCVKEITDDDFIKLKK